MRRLASKVRPIADKLKNDLAPGCERIVIAGSLRRQERDVKDIELVAEPMYERDLFGEPTERDGITRLVRDLLGEGLLTWRTKDGLPADAPPGAQAAALKWGRKYIPLVHRASGVPIDLFIVRPPAQWGAILAIRTGPSDFSRLLVTRCKRYGRRCEGGRLLDPRGNEIDTPTEADFIRACGLTPVAPERR